MGKKDILIELIDLHTLAHDEDNCTFFIGVDSWISNEEETANLLIDIPYHQDFYEALRDYCDRYEQIMLEKFKKK